MRTYSDPEINYWADVFMACHLAREGLRFEDFLADPQGQLNRYGMDDAPQIIAEGYLPLLPSQARLRRQLLLTAADPRLPAHSRRFSRRAWPPEPRQCAELTFRPLRPHA